MPPATSLPVNFTIHGLDPDVAKALRDYADRDKKSLNAAAKDIFRRFFHLPTAEEQARIDAWNRFAGSLPDEDAEEMLETLEQFEQIDEEMWQ